MRTIKSTALAIALLCSSCTLLPTALISTAEQSPATCLGSLPKLPASAIRRHESSKKVEFEADILAASGNGKEALNRYSEAHTLYIAELENRLVETAQGNFSAILDKKANRSPGEPEFLVRLGHTFAITGQHQTAIVCLTESLDEGISAPDNADVYMTRGDFYLKIGDKDKARQDYQKAVELFEKYELPKQKALALSKLNQTPSSGKITASPSPSPGELKFDGKYKNTCYADALNQREAQEIVESSSELEATADQLAAAGKHKEAIRKYNEAGAAALKEAIEDGSALQMEIDTLLYSKEEVEEYREKHRPLVQRSAESNFKIGSSYARLGQFENAIDCFNGTLKVGILPPNDAITYLNRGDAYERMGDKTKAKADFQQAAILFKKHKQPAYQKMAEQRLQAVVK